MGSRQSFWLNSFIIFRIEYGQLYYRDIEREKINALEKSKGDFDADMTITHAMKAELNWWVKNIHTEKRYFGRENPKIVLQTNASSNGWFAVLSNVKTGGRWNSSEKENHINYLELLAIYYAFKIISS